MQSFGSLFDNSYKEFSRYFITSGDLDKLIREDGLGGITSNPTIFEKAISGSRDYDGSIRSFSLEGKSADEIVMKSFMKTSKAPAIGSVPSLRI